VTLPKYVGATKWPIFGSSTTTRKIKMAAAIQGLCLFFHIDNLKVAYLSFYSRWQCNCDAAPIFVLQQLIGTIVHSTQCNGSPEIQDGDIQTRSTNISACRQDRNAISRADHPFVGYSNSSVQCSIVMDIRGVQKFKLAACKPEVLISQLLDKIGTRFQRLNLCFLGSAIHLVGYP